jgi:hypothetical protein
VTGALPVRVFPWSAEAPLPPVRGFSFFDVTMVRCVVCGVILMIQDLDRPLTGFITYNQQPMIDTVASISAYVD